MLKEIAQEMKTKLAQEIAIDGKTDFKIVRQTLSRGLTLTLTYHKLAMTREAVAPSPTEERLILEAFGLTVYGRQEKRKGKYFVISYLYFDFDNLDGGDKSWADKFMRVVAEPLKGESLILGDDGRVRLVVGAVQAAQVAMFAGGNGGGHYYE